MKWFSYICYKDRFTENWPIQLSSNSVKTYMSVINEVNWIKAGDIQVFSLLPLLHIHPPASSPTLQHTTAVACPSFLPCHADLLLYSLPHYPILCLSLPPPRYCLGTHQLGKRVFILPFRLQIQSPSLISRSGEDHLV